jgi:hypothetical protein
VRLRVTPEASYHAGRIAAAVNAAGEPPPGGWVLYNLTGAHVTRAVREEVEAHFRSLGYEVRREMRLSSGQRSRGFWVRRPAVACEAYDNTGGGSTWR